ncbi:hypothetical protein HY386_00160 [Candidatus Daviesbacteria bacterium]|nr:hypothetical protein [Candidatus Daviesbacteria bacterium]
MNNSPENKPSPEPSRRKFLKGAVALGVVAALNPETLFAQAEPPTEVAGVTISQISESEIQLFRDKGVEYGRFFMETGNLTAKTGFAVQDYENGPKFWSAFQRLGGVETLGHPISFPFKKDSLTYQLFQGGALQENPNEGSPDGVALANSMDILNDIEKEHPDFAQRLRFEGVPAHKPGENISPQERLTWIDPGFYPNPTIKGAVAAIRKVYTTIGGEKMTVEDAALIRGYPTSLYVSAGPFGGVRFQRGALQYWNDQLPNGPEPGSVTPFLAGELLKRGSWVKDTKALSPTALNPALAYIIPKEEGRLDTPVNTEAPFPKEFGDLKKDGIVFHNMGNKVGLKLNDPQFLTDYLDPLAKAARPGGVEIFTYNTSIAERFFQDPKYVFDPKYKGYKIENHVPNETFSTYVGENPYLERTTVWVLVRPDGVAEIHFAILPKSGINMADQDINRDVSTRLLNILRGYIIPYQGNWDIPESDRMGQALYDSLFAARKDLTKTIPINIAV